MLVKNGPAHVAICAAALLVLSGVFMTALAAEAYGQGVFEIRTYTTHPGKLGDLHNRFRNHTNPLFVKHGMRLIGYWTPTETPTFQNTLIYILAYPSREAREKSWKAFLADPVWKLAYTNSIKNGKLVAAVEATFLDATEYSPLQ